MSARVQRDFRRQASKVARQAIHALAPSVNAALTNEQATRERVEVLERWAHSFSSMPWWKRLRWLFLGE